MSIIEGKNKELVRSYSPGEFILREGDTSKDMYVIQSGEVKVVKNMAGRDIELSSLVKGDFFGEMSLLESEPRTASIIAVKPTKVLVIKAGGLLVRLRRDPTFAFEMLQKLSNRIRTMNEKLGSMLSDTKTQAKEEVKELYRG
jgi:CRP/FNR family cyclic AMP-dependent transcriptional regulator